MEQKKEQEKEQRMERKANVERNTRETQIALQINLDGSGRADIDTGIGFFDHMLESFARHGLFDLTVKVKGDLRVDDHHTVEDTGIVLGTAIRQALGDKRGICRFGDKILPMDEVLALCALDLGGRPYFAFAAPFSPAMLGDMNPEMVREFFYAVSYSGAMNLHLKILAPGNGHHMAEALFKAFGRALDMAVSVDPRVQGVPSTKGSL